jgi:hypothetical protein
MAATAPALGTERVLDGVMATLRGERSLVIEFGAGESAALADPSEERVLSLARAVQEDSGRLGIEIVAAAFDLDHPERATRLAAARAAAVRLSLQDAGLSRGRIMVKAYGGRAGDDGVTLRVVR